MEKSLSSQKKRYFWIQKIEEAKNFKGSHLEFCRQHNLKPSSFYAWRSQLKKEIENKEDSCKKLPSQKAFVNAVIASTTLSVTPEKDPCLLDPKWVADFVAHLFLRMKS